MHCIAPEDRCGCDAVRLASVSGQSSLERALLAPSEHWPCGASPAAWFARACLHSTMESSHMVPHGCAAAVEQAGRVAVEGSCTLLVHEATFEDDEGGVLHAYDRGHSTADEAIGVAQGMHARHCILTHFSARYPKVPVLKQLTVPLSVSEGFCGLKTSNNAHGGTFVAYDLLTVRGSDLLDLPRLLPALHALFREIPEDIDDDAGGVKGDADNEITSAFTTPVD